MNNGDQEAVVSLNAEILKHVVDRKIPVPVEQQWLQSMLLRIKRLL